MRTLLVVASLWANAEPAAVTEPSIGPWLTTHLDTLRRDVAKAEIWLDKFVAGTQDAVFDIQAVSLADEAAEEVRFVAGLPDKRSSLTVLKREKGVAVQELLPHILAAGHARQEAQHSVSSPFGRSATAAQYVKTPMTYVDGNGVARTALTTRQQGDQFQLTAFRIDFTSTEFRVAVLPDRGGSPLVIQAATTKTAIPSVGAKVRLGESLVLYRDPVSPAAQPAATNILQAAAVELEKEPPRATLFIITPRRGPKLPAAPAAVRAL